jgi:glycosyltransferase involved in cell wall biosynthesis
VETSVRANPARPTVSVVVPTHDRRDLLLRTLRSVLAQQAVALEVLVVDDASIDGTADAVAGLGDPRVRLIRHDRVARVAASRNAGIAAARGTWIALLDDDDLWSPEKLDAQLAAAEHAGCSWVYAGAVEIDGSGRLLGGTPPPSPDALASGLRGSNLMPAGCSNVVVRADVVRAVGGFDTALRHLADWDLWLRLLDVGPPAAVARPLVAYRIHPGQATLDPTGMMSEARLLAARHRADVNSIRRWLAWTHLRRGERRLAMAVYTRAALAGDVRSIGRAAVVAVHAHPVTLRRRPISTRAGWGDDASSWLAAYGQ